MTSPTVPADQARASTAYDITWQVSCAGLIVGCGLVVRRSNCPGNSGNGLFTTTNILKGTLVTVYDGWLNVKGTIPQASPLLKDIAYHWVCNVPGTEFQVRGLSSPLEGRGGGSFANHSYGGQNCKFVTTRSNIGHRYFGAVAESPGPKPTLVLVALVDIGPGEEVLVTYTKATLIRMGMPVHELLPGEEPTKLVSIICYLRFLFDTL
jgi:hypothetical protein